MASEVPSLDEKNKKKVRLPNWKQISGAAQAFTSQHVTVAHTHTHIHITQTANAPDNFKPSFLSGYQNAALQIKCK